MNLNEKLWRIFKYFKDTGYGPDTHMHARHLSFGEQELALLQVV